MNILHFNILINFIPVKIDVFQPAGVILNLYPETKHESIDYSLLTGARSYNFFFIIYKNVFDIASDFIIL